MLSRRSGFGRAGQFAACELRLPKNPGARRRPSLCQCFSRIVKKSEKAGSQQQSRQSGAQRPNENEHCRRCYQESQHDHQVSNNTDLWHDPAHFV